MTDTHPNMDKPIPPNAPMETAPTIDTDMLSCLAGAIALAGTPLVAIVLRGVGWPLYGEIISLFADAETVEFSNMVNALAIIVASFCGLYLLTRFMLEKLIARLTASKVG